MIKFYITIIRLLLLLTIAWSIFETCQIEASFLSLGYRGRDFECQALDLLSFLLWSGRAEVPVLPNLGGPQQNSDRSIG